MHARCQRLRCRRPVHSRPARCLPLPAVQVKPAAAHRLWRRLRVDTTGTLTLRSQKIRLWLFTLDVTAHANPRARSFDFSYR